jgi:hypothetical protein
MIVSVQDNLDEVFSKLRDMGYRVHKLSENIVSDAYIYSEKSVGLSNFYNMIPAGDKGSLLIDSDGKSTDDLLYMLNHRIYSPLF